MAQSLPTYFDKGPLVVPWKVMWESKAPATQGRRSGTRTVAKGIGNASLGKGWASGTTNASLQWATCRRRLSTGWDPPQKTNSEWKPLKKRPIPKGKIHLPINLPGVMFVSGKVTETTYHSPFWRLTKVYEVSSRRLRSMMDDHLYPGNPFYPSS